MNFPYKPKTLSLLTRFVPRLCQMNASQWACPLASYVDVKFVKLFVQSALFCLASQILLRSQRMFGLFLVMFYVNLLFLTSSAKCISSFGLFETPKLPKLLRQLVQHNMLHNSYVAKFSKLKSGWAWRVKKTLFPKILYPPSQIPNFWWYDTTYFYKATCFGV